MNMNIPSGPEKVPSNQEELIRTAASVRNELIEITRKINSGTLNPVEKEMAEAKRERLELEADKLHEKEKGREAAEEKIANAYGQETGRVLDRGDKPIGRPQA